MRKDLPNTRLNVFDYLQKISGQADLHLQTDNPFPELLSFNFVASQNIHVIKKYLYASLSLIKIYNQDKIDWNVPY